MALIDTDREESLLIKVAEFLFIRLRNSAHNYRNIAVVATLGQQVLTKYVN